MSDIDPVIPQTGEAQQAQVAGDTKQAAAQLSTASTYVSSIADLKTVAPEVYKATVEAIMMSILRGMRRHADAMRKLVRESDDNRRR